MQLRDSSSRVNPNVQLLGVVRSRGLTSTWGIHSHAHFSNPMPHWIFGNVLLTRLVHCHQDLPDSIRILGSRGVTAWQILGDSVPCGHSQGNLSGNLSETLHRRLYIRVCRAMDLHDEIPTTLYRPYMGTRFVTIFKKPDVQSCSASPRASNSHAGGYPLKPRYQGSSLLSECSFLIYTVACVTKPVKVPTQPAVSSERHDTNVCKCLTYQNL